MTADPMTTLKLFASPVLFCALAACTNGLTSLTPLDDTEDTEDTGWSNDTGDSDTGDSDTGDTDTGDTDTGDTDTGDTGSDTGSAPILAALTATTAANQIRVEFTVYDIDGDLGGGAFELTVNGTTLTHAIPGGLDSFNSASGIGVKTVPAPGSSGGCGSTQVPISGRVRDAAIHWSGPKSTQVGVGGGGTPVPETGNDLATVTVIGSVTKPALWCGDIYLAANYYDAYYGDYMYDGDIDFIRFTPSVTGVYTFALNWDGTGATSDYDLALTDAGWTTMIDNSYGTAEPEVVSGPLTGGVPYIIRVAGFSGAAVPYTIQVY